MLDDNVLLDNLYNYLYISDLLLASKMSVREQVQTYDSKIPKAAIGLLVFMLLFGLFIVGYDQGQLFSIVQGEKAFEDLYVHELFHDMRHAAGFPCH